MGNEFKGQEGHSAEYFGDTRNYWVGVPRFQMDHSGRQWEFQLRG